MRQFLILFKCGFLSLSRYIEASLINIFNSLIFIFVQYYLWYFICKEADYTFSHMISYIMYSRLLSSSYPSSISSNLALKVKSGDICFTFLKPVSIVKQLVYEELGCCAYRFIFISFPILILGLIMTNFQIEFHQFHKFIVVLILSVTAFTYIDLIFGIMSFYTVSTWGINSLKTVVITLLSGKLLPLSIYPEKVRTILNYLPFKYLYNEPINILLAVSPNSCNSFKIVVVTEILWLIILYITYKLFYFSAVKKVTILGG